ncbi:zinc transporter ZIP3-like isoform X3 [Dermacentor albipictus]|uniref:zinc transporter ZIP3-like isoform X3 n=1 Tax=Dermacentor albipictus TaxID=60249 RepID=UPI0038FCD121
MAGSADKDVTLVQVQTALFGLSLNCALYGVAYTVAASACADNGQQGCFARRTRSQRHRRDCGGARALSYVRCFTAGAFLGALFLAMMPAVRAAVQAAQEEHKTVRGAFPFAETLVFACFCAALYADGMIAAATRRAGAPSGDSVRESPAAPRAEPASPSGDSDLIDSPENSRTRLLGEENPRQNRQQRSYTVAAPSERGIVTEPSSYCGSDEDTDADGPSAAIRLAFTENATKLVWLVIGVYMRETLMTVAVALYAAAMEHSSIVAASAGLVVASTVPAGQVRGPIRLQRKSWLPMAGLLMGRQIGTLTKALVQALATGIFFHVTFMEVLPPKMNQPQERIFKVTFMIIGFALIATADITSSHIAVAYA